MPLPDYSPRSDNFGNWYLGGFQVDSQVEAGYGAGTSLTLTESEWFAFLDAALGSSNWARTGSSPNFTYYLRFANSWEPLTGTITSSANYRFVLLSTLQLNTAVTGTPVTISTTGFASGGLFSSAVCVYAVANQYGMWVVSATKGTTGTVTSPLAFYIGWVKDPVFPTNTSERVRNCVIGRGTNNTANAYLCSRAPGTNTSGIVSQNNVITCSVSTPGANVTDLCFIDTNTSNLNLGSAHNALVYPGLLTAGQIYRIPPASDPDGNTDQNIWLCVGTSHFSFNGTTSAVANSSRLIRVWSDNIT